jgi:putative aldouronate transport system substrate-binding protein
MKKMFFTAVLMVLMASFLSAGGSSQQQEKGATASKLNFTGYPMKAQDQTLSWLVLDGYTLHPRFATVAESPFHTYLQEALGVKVDWSFPTAGSTPAQTFNLVMADAKMPDIIYYGDLMRNAEQYIDEGTIWDLTPYIKEWAPNYYKYLQAHPNADKSMKTDSGKYFGFGFFRGEGNNNDTYCGPVVRKDWLDAQGLPVPKTIADWDNTLKIFKDKYGATFSFAKTRADAGGGISGAFGAYTMLNFKLYVDKNGKIQAANTQPEYKNYLTKLNEWWKAGLLDQDLLTNDDVRMRTNAVNGKVGLTISAGSQLGVWVQEATAAKNGANWMGIEYPRGNDGTLSMVQGGYYGVGTQVAVITKSCPLDKLELAMRALDFGYSEEGILYYNYGKKGLSWEYDVKGSIVWTPLLLNDPDAADMASVTSKYQGTRSSANSVQEFHYIAYNSTQQSLDANNLWYAGPELASSYVLPPGMTFKSSEASRAAELNNPIATYAAEQAVGFITGSIPLSSFDSFVARMNQMGLPELLKIYQGCYDRYQAR